MAANFTKWFPSGFRLINGLTLTNWFNIPQTSVEDGIVATAGGNQATAYKLTAATNRIKVCALNGDSVALPPAIVGSRFVVINDGAATCQVYGSGTDTIDAVATATGVTVSNAKRAIFYCVANGLWQSLGGSKAS